MSDFLSSVTLLPALTLLVVVARRDEKVQGAKGGGVRSSILSEDPDASVPAWLEPILLRLPHRDDLQRLLDRASSRWSVSTVILLSVGVAAALGLSSSILAGSPLIPLLLAGIGACLPVGYLKVRAHRRLRAFEENFGEAIDLLARAARAGHSLPTGLEVVGHEAEEPVAQEFLQVYEEQRFGLPMDDALLGLADRVDLIDVRIFVTAVLIQRESGGNLAENLDSLSQVIRGRFRFKRDVRTKTAHGRMTGLVVGLAPFVAGIGMYSANPEYMAPFLEEPLGHMMLVFGAVMMMIGFFVIRRITDINV